LVVANYQLHSYDYQSYQPYYYFYERGELSSAIITYVSLLMETTIAVWLCGAAVIGAGCAFF
jgi:hypothetical protein